MYLLQPSPENAPERALLQPGILYHRDDRERAVDLAQRISEIDPAFFQPRVVDFPSPEERTHQAETARIGQIIGGHDPFGVAIWPFDEDTLVGIGALLRYNRPVLVLGPDLRSSSSASFVHYDKMFWFSSPEELVDFVRERIVRKDVNGWDYWLPESEAGDIVTAKDVSVGDLVWFPCDTLWGPGVVAGVDDPGPYPETVTDAQREAYQDTRKEGPDGQHVPLTDADILESARKAWSQPFIVVDALGGDPERNGAIGRKLRRRRS
jgi:hypothetical protein